MLCDDDNIAFLINGE